MKKYLKEKKWLILTFVIPFFIFLPSLYVFFTNDDFFFLKISNVKTLSGFLNFFSLIKGPEGFGMYRPLATQVFYWIDLRFFNLNPLGLHLISFAFFFGIIYLVYRFIKEMFQSEKIALISAFLYAVSATHFAHLYYLAAFQELGMTFFVLLSCLMFLRKKYLLSFIFFIPALLSKETATITPLLFTLIYWFQKENGTKALSLKKFFLLLAPFITLLFAYLLIRIFSYGFASGDSYIWDFSIKRLVNTISWYGLWSYNLPETLQDFIGPGLRINPNLLLYWGNQIIPIFSLFIIETVLTVYTLVRSRILKHKHVLLFCLAWFLVAILPVAFLPQHKFTFYLTLPLVGIVAMLGYLLEKSKINNMALGLFLAIWTATSVLTLHLTAETNWITQGEKVSLRVFNYFKDNINDIDSKQVVFVDTGKDETLPFSPTEVVQVSVSGNNFFDVYFKNQSGKVVFDKTGKSIGADSFVINSRVFLGY